MFSAVPPNYSHIEGQGDEGLRPRHVAPQAAEDDVFHHLSDSDGRHYSTRHDAGMPTALSARESSPLPPRGNMDTFESATANTLSIGDEVSPQDAMLKAPLDLPSALSTRKNQQDASTRGAGCLNGYVGRVTATTGRDERERYVNKGGRSSSKSSCPIHHPAAVKPPSRFYDPWLTRIKGYNGTSTRTCYEPQAPIQTRSSTDQHRTTGEDQAPRVANLTACRWAEQTDSALEDITNIVVERTLGTTRDPSRTRKVTRPWNPSQLKAFQVCLGGYSCGDSHTRALWRCCCRAQ